MCKNWQDSCFGACISDAVRDRSLFMAGGGPGSKVGGHRKYFECQRVGIEKIFHRAASGP